MRKIAMNICVFLFSLSATLQAQSKTKIACVGNSIVFGAGVINREKNSYPAQLQAMLGSQYEVTNF